MRDCKRISRDDSRRLGILMMIMGEEEVDMVDMGMREVGEEEVAVDMVGEVVVVVVDMEGEVVGEAGVVVSGVIGDQKFVTEVFQAWGVPDRRGGFTWAMEQNVMHV